MPEQDKISDVLRMMEVVVQKVDGLASDVRTNTYSIDRIENKVIQLEGKVDQLEVKVDQFSKELGEFGSDLKNLRSDVATLSGQFNDVGIMAIKDHKRVDNLEDRVHILEQKPH